MCPASLRLAAHVSGEEDREVVAHLDGCAPCRALVAEQHEVVALAAALPPPRAPSRAHREELAAEILARADVAEPPVDDAAESREIEVIQRRRRRVAGVIFATTIAAAAAIVIVAMTSAPAPKPAEVATVAPATSTTPTTPEQQPPPAPPRVPDVRPAPEPAGVTGAKAQFTRETTAGTDVVRLRDGELAIDALATRAVEIVAGTTRIAIPTSTKAAVVARAGVIESVTVFAGSVEVIAGDRKATVAAGTAWERTTLKVAVEKPADQAPSDADRTALATSSLQAFREGWTALRAGNHQAAILAFDRATDPVVAEDATYWAANATERAGDRERAAKRYADFVARFPASPRAAAAQAAIVRLRAP
jgi:hypothetical protein